MGILNVTPDSFSDGGKYNDIERALKQAGQNGDEEGAGYLRCRQVNRQDPVMFRLADEEEIRRVVPVIEALKKRFDVPVSIDTYKSAVAKAALSAGADLLNDIWGFRYDERCAKLAAEYDVCVCLMHNRETMEYNDFMDDVKKDLEISLSLAEKYGVKERENQALTQGLVSQRQESRI